jgi:hypothetical protein
MAENVFETLWDQNVHAVYNRLRRPIGYFENDAQLASGKIMLFSGEAMVPASEWTVKDLGIDTPAATYLVRRGLQPSWLSPAAALDTKAQADTGLIPPLQLEFPTLDFSLPDFGNPIFQASGQPTKLGTYAIWGGLGVLALLILRR